MGPIAAGDEFEAIDRIFSDALDLPESERSAFVKARCTSQPALLNSVMKLLTQFEKLGSFLEKPAFSTRSDREWLAGRVIAGRFRIVEKLGSGGMGEVYRAYDLKLGDTIALKRIRGDLKNDRETLLRFHAEVRLARKVSHPNVCRLFDLFTEDLDGEETVFVTMEYLDGDTLCQRLAEARPLDAKEILQIVRDIADGLAAAHAQGIVHRDLKPSNVLLARSSAGATRAVITDFGLAHPLEASIVGPSTQSGFIAGSPPYMAPEQFLGSEITPAADIYALSVIVFEMASGRRPFPDESVIRMAVRRTTKDPPSLRNFAPGAPAAWERAIRRGLARNPTQRQSSAREFAQQMESRRVVFMPHVSRRSLVSGTAGAGLLAAFYAIWRYNDQSPLLTEIRRPVLMMLTPLTQTDATDLTKATAITVLLEKQLGQSNRIQLLSSDRIRQAWKRNPDHQGTLPAVLAPRVAREIALRERVDCVLFGSLSQVAEEWTLRLRLELTGSSPESARHWRTHDFHQQDPASAAYDASMWIRRTLAESAADLENRSRRPEELTTDSWHALEEYVRGNEAWHLNDRGAAFEHLREALNIDPQFALAGARLADLLTASGRPDEGLSLYEQAERLLVARNLTDRESLQIRGLFAFDTCRFKEAEHVFGMWSGEFPQDALAMFYLSTALDRLGRVEEAAGLLNRAITLSPDSYSFQFRRAHTALDQGRLAEAEHLCDALARLSDIDFTDQLRCALSFSRLDFARAWAALERMRAAGSDPFQSKAYLLQACFKAGQAEYDEALKFLDAGLDFDRRTGLSLEGQIEKRLTRASVVLQAGAPRDAAHLCREMLLLQPGFEATLQIAGVLARAGDTNSAVSSLPMEPPKYPVYRHWWLRAKAEIALHAGDAKRALELASEAPPARREQEWPAYLVRAAHAAGEAAMVEKYLSLLFAYPGRYWYWINSSEPCFIRLSVELATQTRFIPAQPEAATALRRLAKYTKGDLN
jgi:serine/threonine protein kinase/tetratricopeptide (TPR) repeat protein